ncbi:hypothetical protein [Actinoalloteichus hymeniacidonis]|uniref:hypothetical protein n=1 Tax=Actinoalloteichus hymeniacidonis TaxID=340345 RepID=UPI0012F70C91|nr:hypothetical protein [Actinoalloteichus hymeniacidonis]MBB5909131.1 hypothetical protein [Actinoalloteichus hymeniacidonis]
MTLQQIISSLNDATNNTHLVLSAKLKQDGDLQIDTIELEIDTKKQKVEINFSIKQTWSASADRLAKEAEPFLFPYGITITKYYLFSEDIGLIDPSGSTLYLYLATPERNNNRTDF